MIEVNWQSNFQAGKIKLAYLLRTMYGKHSGEEVSSKCWARVLELWNYGETFDCTVKCDGENNPPSVLDDEDIVARLSITQDDGNTRWVEISMKEALGFRSARRISNDPLVEALTADVELDIHAPFRWYNKIVVAAFRVLNEQEYCELDLLVKLLETEFRQTFPDLVIDVHHYREAHPPVLNGIKISCWGTK